MPINPAKKKIPPKFLSIYLGVDGGGTKTKAVLYDESKNLLGEGISGASNPLRTGVETAVANIFQATVAACDAANKSRGDIVAATIGLAGVRRLDLRQRMHERLSAQLGIKSVEIVTDAEIALFGTTLGKAGIVLIAGTGSICFGKNDEGETATAGGWGPLAGDEGGGAGIARRGLQAIAKAFDGRGKSTKLNEAGVNYFRTSSPENLLVAIYSPQMDNAKIAGFARYIVETAQDGDQVAREILVEAGVELGLAVNAVTGKLKLKNKKFPIGQVGSIFRAGDLITDSLLETVHQFAPKAYLIEPLLEPASAAALMALGSSKK